MLVRFALWLAVSEIQHVQGPQKSETHRMTPNWTWTLNNQKYPTYTKYLPLRSKLWSILLYNQRFSKNGTFYNSILTTMLNVEKLLKIQNVKFHNSLYNFGRDPS